jgi:hypothetical protein
LTRRRPRCDRIPDPEREKKRRIRRQIRALPQRSVVLAQDETDLLLGTARRVSERRGSPRAGRRQAPPDAFCQGRNHLSGAQSLELALGG